MYGYLYGAIWAMKTIQLLLAFPPFFSFGEKGTQATTCLMQFSNAKAIKISILIEHFVELFLQQLFL